MVQNQAGMMNCLFLRVDGFIRNCAVLGIIMPSYILDFYLPCMCYQAFIYVVYMHVA